MESRFKEKDEYYFDGYESMVKDQYLEEVSGIMMFESESKPPIKPIPEYKKSPDLSKNVVEMISKHNQKYNVNERRSLIFQFPSSEKN